ncbi:hypothetical protein [Methylobacterium gnaphalii]|uniref:Uncharacterized protein n=1 Tax=Methylobacterium gnaphalii TaxID=1010610 RepID=A0A512JMD0_9HYPH|nr:hypothetical protein [Methylobacterium gnaphalii]GEP11062.1 hypothetical protein MGN01_29070 [Methylobacterium gnaphalii]GJD67123.1 hypothetical protein MMMDOFMJ_0037 [Methylobacterium gnaphalii]GLS50340.1 hypothetical protein GCM10007885_31920 [Methylobacterium gnaphalii]
MADIRDLAGHVRTTRTWSRLPLLALTAGLLALGMTGQPADAARGGSETAQAATRGKQLYAIEFRSRYALSYGHTFIMYGRLNAKGQLVDRVVAGLHPAGDSPQPWMLGHIVPVKSETGPSDGDLEDKYVSARYRVTVEEPEFRRIVAYIKNKQANSGTWHAIFNNCSGWVADVGRYMGLSAPNSLAMPEDFINGMKRMNEGNDRRTAQSLAAAQ